MTGLVEFHADYLTLTLMWGKRPDMERASVLAAVADACFGECNAGIFVHQGHGVSHFADFYRGPHGVTVAAGCREELEEVRIECKGDGFQVIELEAFRELCEWAAAQSVAWNVTRLDLAWDHCPFDVATCAAAVDQGNVCTKSKHKTEMRTRSLGGPPRAGVDGATCQIGSRASDRMVRIYDRHGFTRMELQVRSRRAHAAFDAILWDTERGGQVHNGPRSSAGGELQARGLLLDFLDFVDGGSDSNISRRVQLSWWQAFVDGVSKIRHVFQRVQRSVDRSAQWIEVKVAPTIAMVMAATMRAGESLTDWAAKCFELGSRRWSPWQQSIVRGLAVRAVAVTT